MADRLAELLVSEGAVAAADLERALARQRQAGGGLDTALLELGLIGEERLADLLALAARLPRAPEEAWTVADPRSRRVFPSKVAERHGLVPFALDGRELSLVAAYPVDGSLLDELGFMLSLHLQPHVAPEWRVRVLVQRLYGTPMPERMAALAEKLGGRAGEPEVQPAAAEPVASSPPRPNGASSSFEPTEPLEPLAAALAQAVESNELAPYIDEPEAPSRATETNPNAPPHWSLGQARAALEAAKERDELVSVALHYLRDFFEYAACFAVTFDAVAGHDALSATDEAARDQCRMSAVALSEPGLFRPVLETRAPYLGPPPRDTGSESMLQMLGRDTPRTVLLYPVSLRNRLLCIFYADNGEAPVSPQRLSELLIVLATMSAAFERILRERKRSAMARRSQRSRPEPELWQTREPARADEESFDLEVDLGDYEVASASEIFAKPRGFDAAAMVLELERSGRGSTERGRLISLLVQHAAESAPHLCARFPGPLEVKNEALAEATPIYEQGPILAALMALGTAATPYLVLLLSDANPQRRRYAVRLLGHLAAPTGFQPLMERAFDSDPRVAAAARDQLESLRFHGEMTPMAETLRQTLMASQPERAAQAALALGALRDAAAVPLLVERLSSEKEVAEASAEALWRITLRRLGVSPLSWSTWWQEHKSAPRSTWLFDALVSDEREARLAASTELASVANPPVAYSVDAPRVEREEAARAWSNWWEKAGLFV